MSQSANVRSLQAIRDFRIAMANFGDDARNALSSVEMEIRRTREGDSAKKAGKAGA